MTELFAVHEVQRAGQPIRNVRRPASVREALQELAADPDSRPVSGGTDLLLDLQRTDQTDPVDLVDLTGIDGFRSIVDDGDAIVLSGGVTHSQIVADPMFRDAALPLAQACLEIGSPQLRNRATLAGNLATASPANDSISALMALGAVVEISGLSTSDVVEQRLVPVAEFFTGFRQTVLAPGELITSIRIPKLDAGARGLWVKLGLRKAQAISVVHGGIVLRMDGDTVTGAALALGSVAATVVLIQEFADALVGQQLDGTTIAAAANAAVAAIEPITDGRATADYRRTALVPVLTRALQTLAAGEQASMWPTDPPTLRSSSEATARGPAHPQISDETEVSVQINGVEVTASGAASRTLLDWIRDCAGPRSAAPLSGVKEGCAEGECGACTIVLDGDAVMSCLVPAAQADGGTVSTVEGLAAGGLNPVQAAFIDEFAVQCGFCIPGFIVTGSHLLQQYPNPTDDQIEHALSGNLCRCTGYYPITQAIRAAASTSGDAS
jgi:carbon-monoxide dehydrogenase medium subunit